MSNVYCVLELGRPRDASVVQLPDAMCIATGGPRRGGGVHRSITCWTRARLQPWRRRITRARWPMPVVGGYRTSSAANIGLGKDSQAKPAGWPARRRKPASAGASGRSLQSWPDLGMSDRRVPGPRWKRPTYACRLTVAAGPMTNVCPEMHDDGST